MFSLTHIRRRFRFKIAKIARAFRYGIWTLNNKKTYQEKMTIQIVKNLLEKDDTSILYYPENPKIYLKSNDGKYIVMYDRYTIKISNHQYFFTYSIREDSGEEIIKYAHDRLERDKTKLEKNIEFNENNFLKEILLKIK